MERKGIKNDTVWLLPRKILDDENSRVRSYGSVSALEFQISRNVKYAKMGREGS